MSETIATATAAHIRPDAKGDPPILWVAPPFKNLPFGLISIQSSYAVD